MFWMNGSGKLSIHAVKWGRPMSKGHKWSQDR